jgi:hypothetical protein
MLVFIKHINKSSSDKIEIFSLVAFSNLPAPYYLQQEEHNRFCRYRATHFSSIIFDWFFLNRLLRIFKTPETTNTLPAI